jgi:hypothetical protein
VGLTKLFVRMKKLFIRTKKLFMGMRKLFVGLTKLFVGMKKLFVGTKKLFVRMKKLFMRMIPTKIFIVPTHPGMETRDSGFVKLHLQTGKFCSKIGAFTVGMGYRPTGIVSTAMDGERCVDEIFKVVG